MVAAKAAGAMESSEARNNPFLSNIERYPKLLCYNIIHILRLRATRSPSLVAETKGWTILNILTPAFAGCLKNNKISDLGGVRMKKILLAFAFCFAALSAFSSYAAEPRRCAYGAGARPNGLYLPSAHRHATGEIWPDHAGRARFTHPQHPAQFYRGGCA